MAWTKQGKPRIGKGKTAGPFFGLELQKYLISRSRTEGDLMRSMERQGNGVTRQFINLLVHNKRAASPPMIEKIGDALGLAVEERQVLHKAAAIDAGYRIGSLR